MRRLLVNLPVIVCLCWTGTTFAEEADQARGKASWPLNSENSTVQHILITIFMRGPCCQIPFPARSY